MLFVFVLLRTTYHRDLSFAYVYIVFSTEQQRMSVACYDIKKGKSMSRDIGTIKKDNVVFAEYVELVPAVCDVLRRFDGKKVTKRIVNAVKETLPSLNISIDNCIGNPDKKELTFSIHKNGCNSYLFYVCTPADSFDASAVIESLEKSAEYRASKIAEFNDSIGNIDKIRDEYNAALESFLSVRNSIPHDVREALNIKNEYLGRAYYIA